MLPTVAAKHTAGSAVEWEKFLTDLHRRGITGEGTDMICADGGLGLLVALPTVLPSIPVQRCSGHKISNVLGMIRGRSVGRQRALHKFMNPPNAPVARAAARRLADRLRKVSGSRRLSMRPPRRAC